MGIAHAAAKATEAAAPEATEAATATAAARRIAGTPDGRTTLRRALHVFQAAHPSCGAAACIAT